MHIHLPVFRVDPPSVPDLPLAALELAAPQVFPDRSVLVVDDEAALADVMGEVLEFAGFKALVCYDGDTAVSRYQQNHEKLTAVLLDLTMPGMHGAEAMAQMRQYNPTIPIIVMTGFSAQEAAQTLKDQAPPARILQKPIPLQTLLTVLEQVISSDVADNT